MVPEMPKQDLAKLKSSRAWSDVETIAIKYCLNLRKGKHLDAELGYETYIARIDGRRIGHITIINYPNFESAITDVELYADVEIENRTLRGLGFGSLIYLLLAKKLAQSNRTLYSDYFCSKEAKAVWRRFVDNGVAEVFPHLDPIRYRIRNEVFGTIKNEECQVF